MGPGKYFTISYNCLEHRRLYSPINNNVSSTGFWRLRFLIVASACSGLLFSAPAVDRFFRRLRQVVLAIVVVLLILIWVYLCAACLVVYNLQKIDAHVWAGLGVDCFVYRGSGGLRKYKRAS